MSRMPINLGSDTCDFEKMRDEDAEKLMISTSQKVGRSAPMNNHGNTCFFNATM